MQLRKYRSPLATFSLSETERRQTPRCSPAKQIETVFEGGITQLHFLLGVQNQDGKRAVLISALRYEVRSATLVSNSLWASCKVEIPLLDAIGHAVELVKEEPYLALASPLRTDEIVSAWRPTMPYQPVPGLGRRLCVEAEWPKRKRLPEKPVRQENQSPGIW